ncbi:MAG: isoaspartyl peptidase/L-asparaginase family protein [Terriglobales bacterium]
MSALAMVVHGGCGRIEGASIPARLEGVRQAAASGMERLRGGGRALDAVEAAVMVLEELPLFNAGRGAVLNADGEIETDAAIMDGATREAGAVACVRGILHPVQLARRVMEATPHVLLAGEGAARFAAAQGFASVSPDELIVAQRREQWRRVREQSYGEHGTVGAVACDVQGHVAAATSTGGIVNKLPGRTGDTPLVGCGTYADARLAVSCTGHGEQIIRMTLARLAAFLYERSGDAQQAGEAALAELNRTTGGDAGLILVDARGRVAFCQNTPNMPICAMSEQGTIVQG